MQNENSLIFKIKLSKKEVQEYLIRYLQAEGLIRGMEETYFVEMTNRNGHFLFEFIVPLKAVETKE